MHQSRLESSVILDSVVSHWTHPTRAKKKWAKRSPLSTANGQKKKGGQLPTPLSSMPLLAKHRPVLVDGATSFVVPS